MSDFCNNCSSGTIRYLPAGSKYSTKYSTRYEQPYHRYYITTYTDITCLNCFHTNTTQLEREIISKEDLKPGEDPIFIGGLVKVSKKPERL